MSALDRIANSHLPRPAAALKGAFKTVNRRVQKQLLYSPTLMDMAPVSESELFSILGYLFPDSLNSPKYRYPDAFEKTPSFEKDHLKKHVVINVCSF
jgi:hypothetical protein